MEKKNQKLRWRYFIDKPFQTRFIVRFFLLILLGFALTLGVILLLDSFKFDISPVHFKAKNINKLENMVKSVRKINSAVYLLEKPEAVTELTRALDGVDAEVKAIKDQGYKVPPAALSNFLGNLKRTLTTVETYSIGNEDAIKTIDDTSSSLLIPEAISNISSLFDDISLEIAGIRKSITPIATIRDSLPALENASLRKDLSTFSKDPIETIRAALGGIENTKSGPIMPYITDIKTSVGIITNQATMQDAFSTVERIRTGMSTPADFIENKPINSFEMFFVPIMLVSILYLILIAVFGLFISHKMAGPVYRIKRTLQEVASGNRDIKALEFKLRKGDELQDLVDALNKFLDKISDRLK